VIARLLDTENECDAIGEHLLLSLLGQLLIVRRAIHADASRVKLGIRLAPAEGDHCHDLVAITAEETLPVIGMPQDCVAHLWRYLPRVFAFAHDPKFNHMHWNHLLIF
jgi:hypothetical protein